MSKLKKLLGKKVVLTHEQRINNAGAEVASALNLFEKAKQDVLKANENLVGVISDIDDQVIKLQQLRDQAANKVVSNTSVFTKLSELTGEQA